METHLAILEAWYTIAEEYQNPPKPLLSKTSEKLLEGIDDELNQVYMYSSPEHNGIYIPLKNSSNVKKEMDSNFGNNSLVNENESFTVNQSGRSAVNESVMEIVEMLSKKDKEAECGGMAFLRSYSSTKEGMNRRMAVTRDSSINLRSPVTYR